MQNQGEESGEDKSWPGRDFELREYLPGSVYLWACGERDDGEDQAPSASDAVVAWAVLLVSNLFERSEFLIDPKKKVCACARVHVCTCARVK